MKQDYVLGFVFDLYTKRALLIKKKKPEWQKDFFNGIGGKVEEDDEDIYAAMARECREETSAETHKLDWKHFCTMQGTNCPDGDWFVYCLSTYLTTPDRKYDFRTNEDEVVIWVDLTDINPMLPRLLGNIPWLIGMALDHRANGNFNPPLIEYSGGFSLPLVLNHKTLI